MFVLLKGSWETSEEDAEEYGPQSLGRVNGQRSFLKGGFFYFSPQTYQSSLVFFVFKHNKPCFMCSLNCSL